MPAPHSAASRPGAPTEATGGRRIFHAAIALAGWALFVYWWMLVLRRTDRAEIRFTGWFLAISVVVIVLVTMVWSAHNRRMWKRKGPRTHVRTVPESFVRDRLGRTLAFVGTPEALRNDPWVLLRSEHTGKTYRPSSAVTSRAERGPFVGATPVRVNEPR